MLDTIKKFTGMGRTIAFIMVFIFVVIFMATSTGFAIPNAIIAFVIIAFLIAWTVLLVDVVISNMTIGSKIIWILVCIWVPIGVIAYYFSGRWKGEDTSIVTIIINTIGTIIVVAVIVSLVYQILLLFGFISPPTELIK